MEMSGADVHSSSYDAMNRSKKNDRALVELKCGGVTPEREAFDLKGSAQSNSAQLLISRIGVCKSGRLSRNRDLFFYCSDRELEVGSLRILAYFDGALLRFETRCSNAHGVTARSQIGRGEVAGSVRFDDQRLLQSSAANFDAGMRNHRTGAVFDGTGDGGCEQTRSGKQQGTQEKKATTQWHMAQSLEQEQRSSI